MNTKWIRTSVVATALALGIGGVAVAGGEGGSQQKEQMEKEHAAQQEQGATKKAEAKEHQKSVQLTSLDESQVKDVQTRLQELGFYKGKINGTLDNVTRSALGSYFRGQLALLQKGRISDQSLTAFGFDKAQIEKVRGIEESKGNMREKTKGEEEQKPAPEQKQPEKQQPMQQK